MLDYFSNGKGKPFVVFAFTIIAYILFALSTIFALSICTEWYGLVIGAILMILAVPVHIFAKKHKLLYILSYALNTVGSGFAVSAYYLEKQLTVIPENMFLPMLIPAIISLITYLLVRFFPKIKKFVLAISTIGTIAMLIAFAVLWIKNGYEFYSFAFFNSVFTLFYVVVDAVTVGEYDRLVIRDISFGSFGIFLVIALVVLFIISEGEILEGVFDGIFDFGSTGETKAKNNKRYK